ncbi:hypothetical protein A11A3_06490 [Alcanivorax hongdengensis A-11-3]|uniref:LysM domain-containing protein n=1 Tax=Alcanivorax hongdengensis A-11-3 TaxID=1177179 RepID=L0WCY5_9GAMM|nr:hypothetical protein A11A3_06490 [Alcanivorax hongdengensis A-11-3]
MHSYLNQPLDMDVELHEVGDLSPGEILVNLASQDEFDAAGVDRTYFLNKLKFQVERTGKDNAVLHISSSEPVREPYLNFLVEFLWPTGRLMREYTVLLDPPSYADAAQTAAPSVSRAPKPVSSAPAPAPQAPASQPAQAAAPAPSSTPASTDAAKPAYASDTSGPHETYTVRNSDTMWRIALNTRPANSVSVQQMLVAIQEMNPDAFINDNVNLVREGTVLRIPNEREVRNISTRNAISQVAEQNRKWRDMLDARGIQAPGKAQVDGSRQVADADAANGGPKSGEVKLVTPDSSDSVKDGDATGSSRQGSGSSAVLENELAIRDENIDRLDRENGELKSRLDDLQDQVATSEKLLKLRNDQISQLQEQLRQIREKQGIETGDNDPLMQAPAPVEDTADSAAANDDNAQDQAKADEASQGDAAATANNGDATAQQDMKAAGEEDDQAAEPAASPAKSEDKQAVKPVAPPAKPKPAAPAKPVEQKSAGIVDLIMANLLYIGAALIVILLLVVLLLRRKQQDGDEADEVVLPPEESEGFGDDYPSDDAFGANLTGEIPPSGAAEDDQEDVAPEGATQDPLENVEVYVAYGRYPQAVDFLRNEINKTPQRTDLKVRLLELLREMGDEDGFQQQAAIYAGTDSEIDAAISRLGGAPASAAPAQDDDLSLDDLEMDLSSGLDGEAPTVQAEPAADAPQLEPEKDDDDLADFDFELDDDTAGTGEDDTLLLEPESESESADDFADFSAELDSADNTEAPASQPLSEEDSKSLSADSLLDLDDVGSATLGEGDTEFGELNLDDMSDEFDSAGSETEENTDFDLSLDDLDLDDDKPEPAAQTPTAAESELGDLDDLDLELDEAPQAGQQDDLADLDLELDMDEPSADLSLEDDEAPAADVSEPEQAPLAEPSPAEDEVTAESPADDLSLDDLDVELDVPVVDSSEAAPAPAETPVVDEEPVEEAMKESDVLGDEDDFDFLGETDENATKLDLARAYIDMGDSEGAKDILNEVMAEGNDQQQNEARELLAQVD